MLAKGNCYEPERVFIVGGAARSMYCGLELNEKTVPPIKDIDIMILDKQDQNIKPLASSPSIISCVKPWQNIRHHLISNGVITTKNKGQSVAGSEKFQITLEDVGWTYEIDLWLAFHTMTVYEYFDSVPTFYDQVAFNVYERSFRISDQCKEVLKHRRKLDEYNKFNLVGIEHWSDIGRTAFIKHAVKQGISEDHAENTYTTFEHLTKCF
jgi:hypothetical protein